MQRRGNLHATHQFMPEGVNLVTADPEVEWEPPRLSQIFLIVRSVYHRWGRELVSRSIFNP